MRDLFQLLFDLYIAIAGGLFGDTLQTFDQRHVITFW
jgi:hypothetical protein